jgi:hypothetical protein
MTPMDNNYRPPGGDPGDHQPTEQLWPGQGVPPGSHGSGYPGPWPQQPGPQAHMAKDHRRARNWMVGIALAALLAGGGVIAGVALAGPTTLSSSPAASTSSTGTGDPGTGSSGSSGTGTAGTAGQDSRAALLASTLNAAGSPDATMTTTGTSTAATGGPSTGPATGTGAAAAGPAARRCARAVAAARAARRTGHPVAARRAAGAAVIRCRFLRRRLVRFFLLRGIDGQFSFRAAGGTIRTLAYERGVIESVDTGSIVVQATDGTIWTWDLVSSTVVRGTGGKISESSLAVGEPVWVGGPVVSGAKDARLIFVRPPSS